MNIIEYFNSFNSIINSLAFSYHHHPGHDMINHAILEPLSVFSTATRGYGSPETFFQLAILDMIYFPTPRRQALWPSGGNPLRRGFGFRPHRKAPPSFAHHLVHLMKRRG